MKENEFLDGVSNIEADVVERFISMDNKLQSKENKPKTKVIWLRFGAVAASFLLIIGAMVYVPMLWEDDPTVLPTPDTEGVQLPQGTVDGSEYVQGTEAAVDTGDVMLSVNADRYNKDFNIISGEYGIVWPWDRKPIYEKYYSIDVDGNEFIGRRRSLAASYVSEKLGSYKATGYDDISDKIYNEYFDAYTIKGVASDRLIAVKMEDKYYVFASEEYNVLETLGGVLEAYSLSQYVELGRFSVDEDGKEKAYRLLNDDEYIWSVLKNAEDAKAANPIGWHENRGNFVSFTVTSEALGVYKNAMYITESGYVWLNAFEGEYMYFIGEEAAGNIIKYAKENSTEAEFEPYNRTVAGKIVEITDEYILLDDSILCKDPADGITYKIMLNDMSVSRYVDCGIVRVGSTVVVSYEGGIDVRNGNAINKAIDISEGIISDGDILIPE